MRALVVAVSLLGACWRGGPPPPPPRAAPPPPPAPLAAYRARPSSSCAGVVARAIERLRPELTGAGMPEGTILDLQDAATLSCEHLRWSREVLDCYDAAASAHDLVPCSELMTVDQREDVTQRLMDVASGRHAPPPYPPPP